MPMNDTDLILYIHLIDTEKTIRKQILARIPKNVLDKDVIGKFYPGINSDNFFNVKEINLWNDSGIDEEHLPLAQSYAYELDKTLRGEATNSDLEKMAGPFFEEMIGTPGISINYISGYYGSFSAGEPPVIVQRGIPNANGTIIYDSYSKFL